jgi:aspartyl protease family protein
MTPDNKAYLFYLALLLLFVGSGAVFGNRRRLGEKLQQAAIWALIFVGVIIAYGFRDVLSSQLYPTAVVQTRDGTLAVKRSRDNQFHITLQVNGVDMDFIVDTGASDLVLTKEDATRVGIDTGALTFLGRAQTANGTVGTANVKLGVVTLGNITDYDLRASVNEGDLFESLLGMSYLSRFREMRITGDTLYLTR